MGKNDTAEVLRLKHTLWIAMAGIGAVLLTLGVTLWVLGCDAEGRKVIPAVLAPVLTVIGTLVGAVAGHAAGGAAGAGAAESSRSEAQVLRAQMRTYESELPTETGRVRQNHRELF